MNVDNVSALKEVSCRVTNSVLKYLESEGYDTDIILEGLPSPYTREYLSDPLNWVTYEIREFLCRSAAELTSDDAVMFKVGLTTPALNPLGGIESLIRKFSGPKMVYRFVPKFARLLDRIFIFKTTITGKNSATIEMRTEEPGYKPSKDSCYYAQGILAAIPTLWGLPPADIHEKKCMYKPPPGAVKQGVQYEAESCVYEAQWRPLLSWRRRLLDNIVGRVHIFPGAVDFKELEQSLRHIDQKNTELIARNKQLAAVREIATDVDKVKTVDEALKLVVERARQIEGILFVLVQTLDETGEYVTTPYYSKIQSRSKLNKALKGAGIELDKVLGAKSTSNKLRYKLSKIKIVQDHREYINNPRVLVVDSLADLCDGIFPRTLCNALQTMFMIKKNAVVPLVVENKLWGIMIYQLTQDVPLDILEMIGTHCALALNNIITTNNLLSRNAELTARNRQLAAVREIAISVDKVRTIDEALALTVEQAREIEGVRMVLVQKMDEARENVITPYYSRFRSDTRVLVEALKAIGFDAEKVLGKSPTSNRLRLPLSKLKVAQEYNKKPRIMVLQTLAELLDGVWPKKLCDAIQKIGAIKKFVIVPLMVEGESWGHILYFLAEEVPTDILEMIGGHCALAIKNIINLNSLELKNAELSVLNRIANITSRSLEMDTLLNDAVKEITGIYGADATAVYLSNSAEDNLTLAAQYGMPEQMIHASSKIFMDDVPMGKFFLSQDNIMTGTMDDYVNRYPHFKKHVTKLAPAQYATSILRFGQDRYGLVTVVRAGTKSFDEDEKSLLISIANQLAVSLENSKLHADVLRRAYEAEIARKSLEESIEKQKTTEEKLRESEERYRTIFESANDLLILIDNKARILDINAKIEDIAGYTREEIMGKDFRSLSGMITRKGQAVLTKNFIKLMSGMDVPFFDVEMIKKSGEIRTIQINAVAVRKEGNIIGGLAILRDITELKQAQENLKSQKELIDRVLATIPNAVLLLDHDLKAVMANHAFYSLFKLKKNRVERNSIFKLIAAPDLHQAVRETLNGEERKGGIEFRYSMASAEKILIVNIFSMKEENLLLVINDVTEEREKQERLYLTDRLASIGEMASGVAHELNNPLTSIIGLSSLLITQDTPRELKEDLSAISAEAQRCAAIVRNLLTFARKHASRKEPVQLKNIVEDVLRLRAYEHQANNITVETSFPTVLPKVHADYFQMQQVFLNIILNAEAAMVDAHQGGKLRITGESVNEHVNVYFSDDGPGIRKENLGVIFNPFFTTKEVGKGTGLGLSICYGIVTSHGGKVYAKSDYGKGATFVVELPVPGC